MTGQEPRMDTREAVTRALHGNFRPDSCEACTRDAEAAIAAYDANPPRWLRGLARAESWDEFNTAPEAGRG